MAASPLLCSAGDQVQSTNRFEFHRFAPLREFPSSMSCLRLRNELTDEEALAPAQWRNRLDARNSPRDPLLTRAFLLFLFDLLGDDQQAFWADEECEMQGIEQFVQALAERNVLRSERR